MADNTYKGVLQNGLVTGINTIIASEAQGEKLQAAIAQLAEAQARIIDDDVQKELDTARKRITLAELQSSDSFTRRARPAVVYAGLLFIFVLHVVIPFIAFLTGATPPVNKLPEEFWWSWSGVVSVWVLGRSYEKVNVPGAINKVVMGTK